MERVLHKFGIRTRKRVFRAQRAKMGETVQNEASNLFSPQSENAREELHMARYGKKAAQKVKRAMHERKRGTLKSGRSGKKVTSRKQAIAIGLSEARREGGKVPRKKAKKK